MMRKGTGAEHGLDPLNNAGYQGVMARVRKMFTAKTRREIGSVVAKCKDFQVLCRWIDEQPSVLITGTDEVGNKHGCTVQLHPGWIHAATCSGQFVAAIIEELRPFLKLGRSSNSAAI